MKVACVVKECNWISQEAEEVKEAKYFLTSHVEEKHLPGRQVHLTAMATLPPAEQELEVDHQAVETGPDKQVYYENVDTTNGHSNNEHSERNFATNLKFVQQQVQNRNMAALPEANSLDTTDRPTQHQLANLMLHL